MSFIPRIDVTVSHNKCSCCEDDSSKPQPKELAVFYKNGKFHAKLNRDDFDIIYKDLIERTQIAIQEFMEKHYQVQILDLPGNYLTSLSQRLPSLEEVYTIERAASEILKRRSDSSVDRMDSDRNGNVGRESEFSGSPFRE